MQLYTGILVAILAGLGASIGLLAAVLIKRARLNTLFSDRRLAEMVMDNCTDMVWVNRGNSTLWQSRSCGEVPSRNGGTVIDISGFGLTANDFGTENPVRGIAQIAGQDRYFNVTLKHVDGLSIYSAKQAEDVVKAERELQRFMQTLTDTFAHLPIGLAIFDRSRQLVLFNLLWLNCSICSPNGWRVDRRCGRFWTSCAMTESCPSPKILRIGATRSKCWRNRQRQAHFKKTGDFPTARSFV